jgi:hypothetical protein
MTSCVAMARTGQDRDVRLPQAAAEKTSMTSPSGEIARETSCWLRCASSAMTTMLRRSERCSMGVRFALALALAGTLALAGAAEGEAVDEDDQIRAAVVLAFYDGELVDDEPVVALGQVKVDEAHVVAGDAAVAAAVFDLDAVAQHGVEAAVAGDEGRRLGAQHLAQRLLLGVSGDLGVEARDGVAQAAGEDDVAEGVALGARLAGGEGGTVDVLVAQATALESGL